MTNWTQFSEDINRSAKSFIEWVSEMTSYHIEEDNNEIILYFDSSENIHNRSEEYASQFERVLDHHISGYTMRYEVTDGLLKVYVTPEET